MQLKVEFPVRYSLLLDEDVLQQVDDLFSVEYRNKEYEFDCSGRSSRSTPNIDEVKSYRNNKHRKIKTMNLLGSNGFDERTQIDIGRFMIFDDFTVSIRSSDPDKADRIRGKIEEIFKGARFPLFHELCCVLRPLYVFIVLFSLTFAYVTYLVSARVVAKPSSTSEASAPSGWVYLLFAMVALLEYGSRSLFPRVYFYLGKQQEKLRMIYGIRNLVFGTILLGVLIGILGNYLSGMVLPK